MLALFTSLVFTFVLHTSGATIWNKITTVSPKQKMAIAQKEMEEARAHYETAKLSGDKDRIARASNSYLTSLTAFTATVNAITDANMAAIAKGNDFGSIIKYMSFYSVPIAVLTIYPWIDNIRTTLAVVASLLSGLIILAVSASLTTKGVDLPKTA